MDNISESRLTALYPPLADDIRKGADMLAAEGITIRVIQGLRTWGEQDVLYAQGRTIEGHVVTNAKGGESWHNFGLAADVAPFDAMGQPDWNTSHPAWQRIVDVYTSLGFDCGANWLRLKDTPHIQRVGRFPASPDDEVRMIFREIGMSGVWAEAFKNEPA